MLCECVCVCVWGGVLICNRKWKSLKKAIKKPFWNVSDLSTEVSIKGWEYNLENYIVCYFVPVAVLEQLRQ